MSHSACNMGAGTWLTPSSTASERRMERIPAASTGPVPGILSEVVPPRKVFRALLALVVATLASGWRYGATGGVPASLAANPISAEVKPTRRRSWMARAVLSLSLKTPTMACGGDVCCVDGCVAVTARLLSGVGCRVSGVGRWTMGPELAKDGRWVLSL